MKILAEKFEYFSKKIEKLSKKSKKILGKEITFEVKDSFMKEVKDGNNKFFVKMLDINVEIPQIKIEGWEPIVSIDHKNEGNIIHNFKCSDEEAKRYREFPSNCDHCKRKRHRNTTFILENENGIKMQVGKTCLIDFLGHDGEGIEFYANIMNSLDSINNEMSEGYTKPSFLVKEILQRASAVILEDGDYFSKKKCEEKGDYSYLTANKIFNKGLKITSNAIEFAQKAEQYILEQDDSSTYVYNCQTFLKNEFVDFSRINYIVSIVGTYFNSLKKDKNNEFFGEVGKEINETVKVTKCFETRYGFGINCITNNGESLTFFDKNFFQIGKEITIKGFVKEHKTFNGYKNTILSKVKLF